MVNNTARLKWDWAGNACRMNLDRWAKVVEHWEPQGGPRQRGRQRQRWRNDLDAYRTDWPELTLDREKWLVTWEAFAQQWDTIGL